VFDFDQLADGSTLPTDPVRGGVDESCSYNGTAVV